MAEPAARKKVTIPQLVNKMKAGDPIVQLAVYDYETAIVADRVGIDILCVSDTGGMVLFGHESTTSVSFEEVLLGNGELSIQSVALHVRDNSDGVVRFVAAQRQICASQPSADLLA